MNSIECERVNNPTIGPANMKDTNEILKKQAEILTKK